MLRFIEKRGRPVKSRTPIVHATFESAPRRLLGGLVTRVGEIPRGIARDFWIFVIESGEGWLREDDAVGVLGDGAEACDSNRSVLLQAASASRKSGSPMSGENLNR